MIATEIVAASEDGDTDAAAEASKRWKDNAGQIVAFLNSANSRYWPKDDLTMMFDEHLDLTTQEASNILTNKYEAAIGNYDDIHAQALAMADVLTDGIVRQFPDKF
jgi:hypothetical protein